LEGGVKSINSARLASLYVDCLGSKRLLRIKVHTGRPLGIEISYLSNSATRNLQSNEALWAMITRSPIKLDNFLIASWQVGIPSTCNMFGLIEVTSVIFFGKVNPGWGQQSVVNSSIMVLSLTIAAPNSMTRAPTRGENPLVSKSRTQYSISSANSTSAACESDCSHTLLISSWSS
jgi:hypothetical protein